MLDRRALDQPVLLAPRGLRIGQETRAVREGEGWSRSAIGRRPLNAREWVAPVSTPAVRCGGSSRRSAGVRPAASGFDAPAARGPAHRPPPGTDASDDDHDTPGNAQEASGTSLPKRKPEQVAIRRPDAGFVGERPDFDLNRPRAERAGEGGAPTLEDEKEDRREEAEEDFPNPYRLMHALGLQDSRVRFYGWMEGSFTANPSIPAGGENFGLFPNSQGNVWLFPQIYFVLERCPEESDEPDYGFRFDNFLSNAWLGTQNAGIIKGPYLPGQLGWDPAQFYGEVHLPVVTEGGVDLKLGRFYSLFGYEDAIAPGRPLLSTSYLFSYSHPFSQIGLLATWHMTERFNWYYGASLYNTSVNGYNRLFNTQGSAGYLGGFSWDSTDDRTNLTASLDVGSNIFPAYPRRGICATSARAGQSSPSGGQAGPPPRSVRRTVHADVDSPVDTQVVDDRRGRRGNQDRCARHRG